MSLVQNLIKKAFATPNINEAASFLASACNRMKLQSKEQIMQEVTAALVNINLSKLREHSAANHVCKDSPETLQRLQAAEAQVASLLVKLSEAQHKNYSQQPDIQGNAPETLDRLRHVENQVVELRKALNVSQEMHLKESALVRTVMQREIDRLQHHVNSHQVAAHAKTMSHHREKAEYRQHLAAADKLIKTQHEARLKAEAQVAQLNEKLYLLQVEQNTSLHARLAKTIDELSTTRNMLRSHIAQRSLKK